MNKEKVNGYLDNALTLATTLNPIIGYDKACKLAHYTHDKNVLLKEANEDLQFLSEDEINEHHYTIFLSDRCSS